jgi:hypothetical protein
LAFTSSITGEKNMDGMKRLYGVWDGASVTTGTITWKGSKDQIYNVVGAGAVQSTAVTTAGSSVDARLTAGTLVLTFESSAAGFWWVDVL